MSTKGKKTQKSAKNYIIALFIVFIVVFLTFYIFKWFNFYEKKDMVSPLTGFCNEIQYNELENSLVETPNSYFVYVSYTNDDDAYRLEKQIKRVIVDNELQSKVYYLNVSNEKNEDNFINNLNNKLNLKDLKIKYLPAIVYYSDESAKNILNSKFNKLFTKEDFKKLISESKIEK